MKINLAPNLATANLSIQCISFLSFVWYLKYAISNLFNWFCFVLFCVWTCNWWLPTLPTNLDVDSVFGVLCVCVCVFLFAFGGYCQMSAANFNASGGSMGPDQPSPELTQEEATKVRFSRSSTTSFWKRFHISTSHIAIVIPSLEFPASLARHKTIISSKKIVSLVISKLVKKHVQSTVEMSFR